MLARVSTTPTAYELHPLVVHVAIPPFASGHERQHDQSIAEGVEVLIARTRIVAELGQAEHLDIKDRKEEEQNGPEQEQVANGRERSPVAGQRSSIACGGELTLRS